MTDPRPHRPAGAWQRVPVGWRLAGGSVAVLVLFAAIGLGSTATGSRTASRHPGLLHAEATIVTILLAWAVVMTLAVAIWALTAKGGTTAQRRRIRLSWWQKLALLAAVIVLAFITNALLDHRDRASQLPNLRIPPQPSRQPAKPPSSGVVDPHVVTAGIIIALVLTVLALLALRWWDLRRRPPLRQLGSAEDEAADALAEAVDAALADLDAEPDPRRAVVAAYARMERVLRGRGVPRREWETPLEYLDRVLREWGGQHEAVNRLTELFELAKFSHHDIDQGMKREAIAALEQLRAGLTVPA